MSDSAPLTSGFSFSPNTNTMDPNSMPSDKAAAARKKAMEIMNALDNGQPGDADKLMGKREAQGNRGIVPLDWLKRKLNSENKEKKAKKADDNVIR